MWQVREPLITLIATAVVSAALTYILINVSRKLRLVAVPVADRWHTNATPNTGGVAVFFSSCVAYMFFGRGAYAYIALAAAGIAALGALDDRFRLSPSLKFAGQSLLVAYVINEGVLFRPFSSNLANIVITFLWITGVTNAFNLIDNMDGLCAGVAIIIGITRGLVSFGSNDIGGVTCSAIIVGAFLGFLCFNYHPAKIFMGDSGSMFAGFALASLAIAAPVPKTRVFISALLYPALTFLYPIFDTAFVSILRRAAGRPITVGGRDHTSHRLASLGHKERTVVWILWTLTAAGALAGSSAYWFPLSVHVIGILLVATVSVFGIFLASLPNYSFPVSAPIYSTIWRRLLPSLRVGLIVAVDSLLAGIALTAAFLFRWGEAFSAARLHELLLSIPIAMVAQLIASIALRTFNSGWRWFGLRDSLRLAQASLLATSLAAFVLVLSDMRGYSRSVLIGYSLFSFGFGLAFRWSLRCFWETLGVCRSGRRAAIVGSLENASILLQALAHGKKENLMPAIILSTEPAVNNTGAFGIPVFSLDRNSVAICKRHRVECLIITEEAGDPDMRHFASIGQKHGLDVLIFNYGFLPIADEESRSIAVGF